MTPAGPRDKRRAGGWAGAKRTMRTRPARPDEAMRAKKKNRNKCTPKCRWWHCSRLPWLLSYCSAVRMQYSGQTDPHSVRYNNNKKTAAHRTGGRGPHGCDGKEAQLTTSTESCRTCGHGMHRTVRGLAPVPAQLDITRRQPD